MTTSPPTDGELAAAGRARSSLLRRLAARPDSLAAMVFVALLGLAALAAPVVAPHQPLDQDLANALQGPGSQHWLGTDTLGRDVFSRLVFGARPMLLGVAETLGTAVLLGLPAGLAAGYLGGRTDAVIRWLSEIVLAMPAVVLLLVVLSLFSSDQTAVMVALGVLLAPGMVRVVRSQALAQRRELFIDAAAVSGLGSASVLWRHVLPRVMSPLIVQATLIAASAVLMSASLGFLGFGPPPPSPSWGQMVAEAATQIQRQVWLVVPSGAAVAVTSLCLAVMGDTIRDAVTDTWSHDRTVRRAARRARPRPLTPVPVAQERVAPTGSEIADPDLLLSVRDLTVSLAGPDGSEVTLLDGVSFDVRAGEIVGVVGESGCGKTLTSLGVLGMLPPGARVVDGTCIYAGSDLSRAGARTWRRFRGREIAMISQSPMVALDPAFTVRSQVAEAVRTLDRCSRREARRRVGDLLAMVGLPDAESVGRKYPHELSGGMAQRVCIAIALAGEPKLLVADEPTTALDVTAQAAILDLLRSLQRERNLAVVLITHDWGVVADVCHRAVVMYAGQVVEQDVVSSLLRRPLHPYSEALLRSNPAGATPRGGLPVIPERCHSRMS